MMTKVTSLLTSKKASEILGVHDSTVKRWCNQGELSSQATKGGHRRISWDDLMNFAKQQKIAHPFNDFGAKSFEVYSAKEDYLKNSSCAPFVEIVLNWMRDGHLIALPLLLFYMVEKLNIPFEQLCDDMIFPIMKTLGYWWEDGKINVAEEHRMTQEWIHALYILRHQRNLLRGPRALSGPQAILACGDDNTHELALHCLRIVLEERGYGVIFLGARVPATQLKACIDRENPVLVGVSFSPLSSSQEINDAYETLAGGEWQNYALVFGGVWLNQELKLQSKSFLRFGQFTKIGEFSRWLKYGET